jgi:hypothetical protein
MASAPATAIWMVARTCGGMAARSSRRRRGVMEALALTGAEPGSQPLTSWAAGVKSPPAAAVISSSLTGEPRRSRARA